MAYDQRGLRAEIRRTARIAQGIDSSQRLGRHRCIIESRLSWLTRNRRLVRRYDRPSFSARTAIASTTALD